MVNKYVGKLVSDRETGASGIVVSESECDVVDYYTHAIKVRFSNPGSPLCAIFLVPNPEGPCAENNQIEFLSN